MNPPDVRGGTEQQLISHLKTQQKYQLPTVFLQEPTEEFQSETKKVAVYLNYRKIQKVVTIGKAILARDYKGLSGGFEMSNGVIEWKSKT